MVTITYRLIGSVNSSILERDFTDNQAFEAWRALQINIVILTIESTHTSALERIYR